MGKTDRQLLIEMQQQKPIREIMETTLEKHRGRQHQITLAAVELDVSITTIYKWCEQLNIDLKAYVQGDEEQEPTGAAAE